MKKIMVIIATMIVVSAFVNPAQKTGIKGMVVPANAAYSITAIQGNDSVRTVAMSDGSFFLDVKPGNWIVKVKGERPYLDAVKYNVMVLENQLADAGTIVLKRGE